MIIDLSSHNGKIDFSKVKDVEEVIIRATMGYGTVDKNLQENANGAMKAGFPVSYYHEAYVHNTADVVTDAKKQANFFLDTIQSLPKPANLCIDLEEYDDKNTPESDTHATPAAYELWLQTFLDVVENRTQIIPMIYSYKDYLNRHLPADHKFGDYPLWIAAYQEQEPGLPVGWSAWTMWQYSEHGKLLVSGDDVDLSRKNR